MSQSHTRQPGVLTRVAALQVLELQRRVQGTPYASHLQARSLSNLGTAPGGPMRLSAKIFYTRACTDTSSAAMYRF